MSAELRSRWVQTAVSILGAAAIVLSAVWYMSQQAATLTQQMQYQARTSERLSRAVQDLSTEIRGLREWRIETDMRLERLEEERR